MRGTISLEYVIPYIAILLFIQIFVSYYNIPYMYDAETIDFNYLIPYLVFFIGIYSILYLRRFIPKNEMIHIHYSDTKISKGNFILCDKCHDINPICYKCNKPIIEGELLCGNNHEHICKECSIIYVDVDSYKIIEKINREEIICKTKIK
jgi:hypothetical protein